MCCIVLSLGSDDSFSFSDLVLPTEEEVEIVGEWDPEPEGGEEGGEGEDVEAVVVVSGLVTAHRDHLDPAQQVQKPVDHCWSRLPFWRDNFSHGPPSAIL